MTKVQHILMDIDQLKLEELELILNKVLKKIEESNKVESLIDSYMGIGKGVWTVNAQEFVDNLREDDREYLN